MSPSWNVRIKEKQNTPSGAYKKKDPQCKQSRPFDMWNQFKGDKIIRYSSGLFEIEKWALVNAVSQNIQ